MTQEEFIKVLDTENYSYEIEGDKIIVTYGYGVDLSALTSIPPGVVFKNGGYIDLSALTSLPPGVEFRNGGDVWLKSLPGIWFDEWEGNIEGIESKRLLNVMIKQGVFI
jgi:hypothetical protein